MPGYSKSSLSWRISRGIQSCTKILPRKCYEAREIFSWSPPSSKILLTKLQVRFIPRCVLKPGESHIQVRLIHQCVVYPNASYIPVRLISRCVLYSRASYIQVRLIPQCVLYPDSSYIPVRLISRLVFYPGASYIPIRIPVRPIWWEVRYLFFLKGSPVPCY